MPRPTDWNAIGLDSDPTPGEPDQIRTLSTELNHLGSEARRISTAIDAVMNTAGDSVFVGEAADALRGKVNDRLRGHIEDVAQSFESAATALSTWADKLVDLQSRADGALNSGRGLSEDDPDRETYASTARQAGTEHGEGASAAAGSISGVSDIQLPISECQIFWEAFQWLAIILIIPALIFGGPIALLALGVNLTLFIKTIVDFANGNASFLDLFLAGLGILAPTTKALPIFQIIKGVATSAFAKGFANIARGTFQALRNLFTNGFRPTTLLLGLKDLVRLGSTWVYKGGLWVLDGIHNLPNIISHGVDSLSLTVVQGFKAIPGFVRGLPETLSRGWQTTKEWVGQEFGGTKWLRILLPVDAAEIGEYGFARALRISLFDRGVLGRHVFGAPITSGIGRTISSVPVDPRTVDALVDMPRIQLNEVRFGAGSGQSSIRNLDLNIPSTHLDVTSTLRPPSLNLGDVGAIAHRGNFGVHAARTVDALVDMPHVQLGNVRVENFGALGGHAELGVSAGATPTITTASGLHVPASAGVPGATHGITGTPVTAVSGGAHTTLTGLPPTPANLTSHADVLLPGGAHNATQVPGSTVLTGTHSAPPPVAATLGDLPTANPTAGTLHSAFTGTPGVGAVHAPGTPGIGAAHTTLTGTPGTGIAHTALDSAPAPGAPHDVTAPHSLLTGPTTVAHPSPTGLGHGGPGHVDTGVSAFDLLAGTRHNTPHSPVAPGTGNALADRTTSALHANQTRLHLDELLHQPGSPRPGGPAERLPHGSPSPAPGTPDRLTITPASPDRLTTSPANPITSDRLTVDAGLHEPAPAPVGGSGRPGTGGDHGRSALDLVDTGRSARTTDGPAFAGAPARTDADKGLAGSASGDKYRLQFDESALGHAGNDVDGVKVVTDRTSAPYRHGASVDFVDSVEKQGFTIDMPSGSAGHGGDAFDAAPAAAHSDGFDGLLKDPDVVRVPGDRQLSVEAPRGGTPELHGDAVGSLPTPTSWDKDLPGRGPRLTPAQIEEAWFRDGQRVDALFGHVDDPLRQARREAWRDHVQARYDLGRAEDLLPHNGHAGSSDGPTAPEIHARENVDTARQQYDATHGRLDELGIDPVRLEAQLSDLRRLSLKERPRALGGTALPADDVTPPPAHSAPALHSETEAATPLTPPQQLSRSLGEHAEAQRGVQQAESNLANAGANQRPAMQAALDKANDEASRIAVRLDEDMTQALTDGRLSQRDLNLLVDQFAGAGEIQRALRFQEHALGLDAQARHAPETAGADHFIRTGKEIEQQSLELRGLTQRLENLVRSGKKTPLELQGLARTLDKAAGDLDASLKGFVKDAAELGGVYTLRNEHAPVSTVAHELARKVDDAVKAARPGDAIALKGFHGTEFSISRLQHDMPEVARHLRSNKAYAEVPTGNQWKAELPGSREQWQKAFPEFEDFEKLSDAQKTHFVQELSERNITQLRQDVREVLDSLPQAERAQFEKLLTSLENLPYRIKHATPAYHAIANSGVMSSQGDLTRRGIRFLASGKSSGKNTSNLGNDDFVFFRMEAGDKPMATRYGPTTLVFDAKVLEERSGWVSLHDQLHPLDREAMRDLKFGDDTVRSAKYDDGFEEMGKRARWTYEYPGGGGSRTVSFDQEVFHGAHVQEALALSVVREVHRIGGGFKDDVLKLVQGPADVEKMGAVVSKLYRPEAKFGSGLPINPFSSQVESRWPKPLQVHDMEGDGRYLADGTVDPAARAAGKAFDEASDKVRQADNAVVSGNRKAQRYNLNKAQPLAEQAVKLTQEFHDIAQGARKDMAKGLLDERTKLLDDINGRIGALKGQPDTDAVKAQPRPGRNQGAGTGTSSSTAAVDGPHLNTLPRAAEDALNGVTGITDHMRKMIRALANSDGFRALPDSKVGAQTTAAVDLGRTAFGKAFKNLAGEGLVRGDTDGLHLTDKGRALFLPPGTETRAAPPSVSGATDVHTAPAHDPATAFPAPHDPAITFPAPHDLDTASPAPHHAGTDTPATGADRSVQAQRQNDALSLLDGTPPPFRGTGDTARRPGETPWAQDSARFDELLGGDGRPFREAWVELSSARVELNRVEDLRGAPGGASTSQGVSEFDVQLNHELVSARERFRTAYTNLEDLGVRPTEIEARISEIERDATRRGATLGAGKDDTLPDTAPPAVDHIALNNSGVSGPNGLTIERSVGQDNAVTLRMVDQHLHPDPTHTVVARQGGGFDVRNTQSDTVETYTANGDRTGYEMPLHGADGRPTGLRLHTDINGHGTRGALTVNGPGADRLTAFPLPGDATRITRLDTGVTRRVDAQGLHLDEGVQLTGRDGVPTGTDRVRVADGADVHVTDLAGDRLDLRVQDLGDGNGVRVTDETTGVSVRHDGQGRLQETGVALTDPRGTRGERFLADDGTGRFTLTDPSGARQPQTVTALPDGAGFRVTDGTSGATSRFTADGRYRDTGLALFDPAANTRGGRIVVPDGTGGHRLTDTAGQPLPERVIAVDGNRPRTIDDVTGESVLYDVQGRPTGTSTALADPAGGPRGARFAEPDGAGGLRLTDADGNRLPDTVTALADNGGFRTVHDTGHRTFAPNGDLAGDGLRLTGRDGAPAGHLDRPLAGAPHWLDDTFAPDPARAVALDPAGRIEIARPGGGNQVFDQNTGRFVQETVPLPDGGRRTTLADGTFTRYDGQGAVTATGTPLPVGHGGRHLVVEPPTAQHPGAWLEDAAGGRLAHWDAVRRPDGTTRIVFADRTSPRHGEFVHLAADGSVARQGFNVLDNGRPTQYRYVVDHATNTWERTTRSGAPVAAGSFQHGTADLSGAAGGHVRLLSSTKKQVPVFERRVLPGASGGAVDSFRRTDTIDFARTNPRTHWVRWDDTGTPVGTGSRRYDTAGTGWRDTDGWGRTVREYRDGLQKFNGRTGHTLGVNDGNGAWTWHRYDGDGRVIASGPRTREHIGSGWTDRTADGRIAQRQWGMAEWPERAGQYQEHAVNPADGSLRATWERHSPHGKEVGRHEVFGDGFLTTDRWREQRPPTLIRTRWLAGAEHVRPPYAHVRGDDTYQLFTWTKEAGDGATSSGVRYVGMDGSALDLAADGTFARFSGKLHDGTSLKVGDHAARPGHAPADPAAHPWQAGNLRGYREPLANDPQGRLWQDVHQDAGGVTRTAREGRPNGVVREFTGDRTWVDRDPHGNLVGQSHANPDGTAGRVVEGSGRADSGRWTWRELDAQGAELGSGRREFFRGSNDSRLPWDDSYRDYDGNGNLVRERRMLDSGRYVDAWRDNQGDWRVSAHERNGTPVAVGNGEQVRRWWNGRAWQDRWTDGARYFRDELRVPGQGAPTVLRETPLHNGGPLRVRAYSTTVTPNTPAGSVWKEFDHGSVVRERKADGGGFLETDAWRGQWNRYSRNGDLIGQRTDNGLVFERDTFNTWRLVGNEYDFRGALTEIRGWGRTTREAQRMPWSGTVLPDGDAALREARYEPYWQSVAKKAALEFGQEFILEFGANLAVNGIVAAVQNKPFTGKDALKSFANAAVGASIKTGLSTTVHENRALGFEKLGQFKAGIANIDGGKPWTRRPLNHDKTWVNEWAGNETPTRWRGGMYDFSFGVLSSALSGWVNGSMNAAVWGVTNADGQTVKLHGGDAVWEGGINAAASVTTAATTGLVKNVFVMSAGSRLFHRQGFADFWIQLPFKIFEKTIQSLYLTSTYRASINPTYYQAP
ncbi:hypothetical protein AB0D74_37705 [Streptomyces sp. NPDC048278]|uniref:hypothetical protein n=1 Tax=Streptomyces sp. NPDC048278 TaxID=3155809 RepID=UPI0034286601